MRLRESIRPLVDAKVELHHDVFLTVAGSDADVSDIIEELDPWYEYQTHPIQTVAFRVGDGVWAHHCFFAKDCVGLIRLDEELRDLDRWLKYAPDHVCPKFTRARSQLWTNVITWLCLLYHLATEYDDNCLQAELMYSDSDTVLRFEPWRTCPASADCDPVPLITLTPSKNRARRLWRPGGSKDNQTFPQLIEACLTTDVLRASMNAVLLLKYYGENPLPDKIPRAKADSRRKPNDKEGRLQKSAREVRNALVKHHCLTTGERDPNDPLTQEEIALLADVSQSTVSRVMPFVMPPHHGMRGGMDMYQLLCQQGRIRGYLKGVKRERGKRGLYNANNLVDPKAKRPDEILAEAEESHRE